MDIVVDPVFFRFVINEHVSDCQNVELGGPCPSFVYNLLTTVILKEDPYRQQAYRAK